MFKYFYFSILGDFNDFFITPENFSADLPNLVWIIYIFSTLLMNIVILNLLVAVISDTYSNVVGNEMLANNYEKMTILQDIEKEISNKELSKFQKKGYLGDYLFVADFQDEENEEEDQQYYSERMRNKIYKVENIVSKIENKVGKIDNTFEKFELNQTIIYEKIDQIEDFLKKN